MSYMLIIIAYAVHGNSISAIFDNFIHNYVIMLSHRFIYNPEATVLFYMILVFY